MHGQTPRFRASFALIRKFRPQLQERFTLYGCAIHQEGIRGGVLSPCYDASVEHCPLSKCRLTESQFIHPEAFERRYRLAWRRSKHHEQVLVENTTDSKVCQALFELCTME